MSVQSPASPSVAGWRLEHTYAELPSLFHSAVPPTPVREPRLVRFNRSLAVELGLDVEALDGPAGVAVFSGNRLPSGARSLAQAYAGHQYGHFTTLGDGRALLLGEQITPTGARFDVQLKGSGRTPYSRGGDGRAALGPMLREYIISEAMHALDIPTTRSLAVVATGETVARDRPLPGAVLTRVAASHLRVGTFEWPAALGETEALRMLTSYALHRHYPDRAGAENPSLALVEAVVARQAHLVAQWMLVGFVHGVMNTDNMAISGETIDYGPCAFIDRYDPATVFSSIDRHGRYAYGNQPRIAQWNLARLAEALLPLLDSDEKRAIDRANTAVQAFAPQFREHWLAGMRRKLGLFNAEAGDEALIGRLLASLQRRGEDYTHTFAQLSRTETPLPSDAGDEEWSAAWRAWAERRQRQPQSDQESLQLRQRANPVFIPRNHLVEAALSAAEAGDEKPLDELLRVLSRPFDYEHESPAYAAPAPACDTPYRTFCGT